MKSYTDLEQSKKLAGILPLESADMHYCLEQRDILTGYEIGTVPFVQAKGLKGKCNIIDVQPAWSFTTLLGILTECKICHYDDRYYCQQMSEGDEFPKYSTSEYDNPVDACVAMIEKLHELNLL